MIQLTMTEWSRLPLGSGEGEVPSAAADRLLRVASNSAPPRVGAGGVLWRDHSAIRSGSVVGIVSAAGVALEVLPKIGTPKGNGALRQHLVHMLSVAHDLALTAQDTASVAWHADTLLDIIIRVFADRLLDLVRLGLPRRYNQFADDLRTLRGRLNVSRQFTTLAAAPQRLACRFDELAVDIELNQVIKAALRCVLGLARATETQRRLRELLAVYDEVADVGLSRLPRYDEVPDRGSARWQPVLTLARLFLAGRRQGTSLDDKAGFALLFDMNVLFEKYVARMLARGLAGTGLQIVTQGGHVYCLATSCGGNLFRTQPDLMVRQRGQTLMIIDTKWKQLTTFAGSKQGVAQPDIYQMMAYGQLYQCPSLLLLYPHHIQLGDVQAETWHTVTHTHSRLGWATLDITAKEGVSQRLRTLVMSMQAHAAA